MSFRRFSLAALVYTLPVILWGAYVRASNSGAGCGNHWPLCGETVLPIVKDSHTLVEFAHRASSGLAGIVALVLCVWAFRAYPRGSIVRAGGAASLFFMTTEALVGALLVKFELVAGNATVGRAIWMSIHLVNTFLLLASLAVTAWWARHEEKPRLRGQGATAVVALLALASLMLLGVSGAVTALGDTLFPAANLLDGLKSDLAPTAHLFVRLRVWHPVIALAAGTIVVLAVVMLAQWRPVPAVRRAAMAIGGLYLVQLGLGVGNIVLLAPAWLQLVHLLVADCVWISLVLLVANALAAPAREPEAALAPGLS